MAIYKHFLKHLIVNGLLSYKPVIRVIGVDPNTGAANVLLDLTANCSINELNNGYTVTCTASETSSKDYVVDIIYIRVANAFSVDGATLYDLAEYTNLNVRKTSTQRLDITFTLTLTGSNVTVPPGI